MKAVVSVVTGQSAVLGPGGGERTDSEAKGLVPNCVSTYSWDRRRGESHKDKAKKCVSGKG